MLRVVLDTNIIVSGAITDHGTCFQILKKWERGDFLLIVSEPILREIEQVLHYPRIKGKRHLTDRDIEAILQTLARYGLNTPAEIKIEAVSEDPADNKFIIAAIVMEVGDRMW